MNGSYSSHCRRLSTFGEKVLAGCQLIEQNSSLFRLAPRSAKAAVARRVVEVPLRELRLRHSARRPARPDPQPFVGQAGELRRTMRRVMACGGTENLPAAKPMSAAAGTRRSRYYASPHPSGINVLKPRMSLSGPFNW